MMSPVVRTLADNVRKKIFQREGCMYTGIGTITC